MLRRAHDEEHVRQLLDQRSNAVREAMQLNDYDSPSVYSSPFFSPRPSDISDTRSLLSYRPPPSPPAPVEPRTRLNELAHSMLDLDDHDEPDHHDPIQEPVDADQDDHDDSRLSLLGPKMRFHGKAPWEMDADTLDEEDDESDDRSTRGRDGIRKGLASFRSSSRSTTASATRPSGESSRSSNQPKPKRSFETNRSFEAIASSANSPYSRGGAVHPGQAPTPPPRQSGIRLNLPFPRSETPPRAPASPGSITPLIPTLPLPFPETMNTLPFTSPH
ncbi:hypothetical protein K438DRAFT_1956600 [Mycena galopus ATCC 62051]|nr:hypothetical protein K438DRAFT_1956600 [Mycena galopus ATCC 62051]